MSIRRLFAMDANGPQLLIVPSWGPDAQSRRLAVDNTVRANPANPRTWGIGVRPAPPGSVTEGTKTDAWLPPQQTFRGVVKTVVDPTTKAIKNVSSFPAANVQVNPILMQMSTARTAWGLPS